MREYLVMTLGALALGATSGCASRTECVAVSQEKPREASSCIFDQWQTLPGGIF